MNKVLGASLDTKVPEDLSISHQPEIARTDTLSIKLPYYYCFHLDPNGYGSSPHNLTTFHFRLWLPSAPAPPPETSTASNRRGVLASLTIVALKIDSCLVIFPRGTIVALDVDTGR